MKNYINISRCLGSYSKTLWVLAGAASGAASVGTMFLIDEIVEVGVGSHPESLLPGFIYGIVISIIFYFSIKRCWWRTGVLINISSFSHYIAWRTAVAIAENFHFNGEEFAPILILAGFVAGAIGAATFACAIIVLYPQTAWRKLFNKTVCVGALFGTLLFFVSGVGRKSNFFVGYSLLYVPWQAAVAYCLSLFYAPVQENQTKLPSQKLP